MLCKAGSSIFITGPNAEHCSKRDAAPQHQKIDLVYSAYIGQYALPTLSMYGIIKLSSSLLPLLLMRELCNFAWPCMAISDAKDNL